MGTHSEYLDDVFDPVRAKATVAWLQQELVPRYARGEFDAIAFRGGSGAITMALAVPLGIPMLFVRKDASHAYTNVEGKFPGHELRQGVGRGRYVVVDDFVSSGATLRAVREALGPRAKCVAVALYNASSIGGYAGDVTRIAKRIAEVFAGDPAPELIARPRVTEGRA